MRAYARLRGPDGAVHELVHGDIIGRLRIAGMPIDDGRVSEAHAMVSLREGELRLIALRGIFAVGGRPVSEVALAPGLEIQLARGLSIAVEQVFLPESVLGLEAPGLARQALPGVCSIQGAPQPRLVQGWVEPALAHLWSVGDDWRLQLAGAAPRPLAPGDRFEAGGLSFQAVAIPLAAAGESPTRQKGGLDAPLHLIARYDTAHVHREGQPPLALSGVLARLVSELVAMDGPVGWQVLARQLWPHEDDAVVLRSRLDVTLSRIRRRLRGARIRSDLVRTDGAGSVELLIYPHDKVEDRT